MLILFFKNKYDSFSFDDLDTCITELSINFDGYLKAYQSDLASLVNSDAFIQLPKDKNEYKKGENYPIIRYR